MIWLLGGYMWLFVHRPFEIWPTLADLQVERAYMLLMIAYWAVQPNKGWLPNRIHAGLVVFTLVITAAWVASPYMGLPYCATIMEDYYKVLVFYVLVVTSVRDEDGLRKLLTLYLIAVALYTGHSFWEYLHGRCQWRMGVRRMIGVDQSLGDANGFAANLDYTLPLLLPFWLSRPRWWVKTLLIGYTLLAYTCILLTGSRTGLLGVLLCTLMCLFSVGRIKTALGLIVALAVAAPVVYAALPEDLQLRYMTIIDPSVGPANAEESAEGRINGLVYGFEAWQRSPLLGFGPGGFKFAEDQPIGTHNIIGQTISETGAAGAAAFLFLLACFWLNGREARRLRRENPELRKTFASQVVRSVGLILVLLLFHGQAGHNLFRYYWVWFGAFQAIGLHCLRQRAALAAAPEEEEAEGAAPEAVPA